MDVGYVKNCMDPFGKMFNYRSHSIFFVGNGDILQDDGVEEYPNDVHHADVKFIPQCDCGRKYNGLLDSSMMCAADFVNGADACQGDSGK